MHITPFSIYTTILCHSSYKALLLLHYAFSHISNIKFLARMEWMPVTMPSIGTTGDNTTDSKQI